MKISFQRQSSELSPSDRFLQRLQGLEATVFLHDVVRSVTVASRGTVGLSCTRFNSAESRTFRVREPGVTARELTGGCLAMVYVDDQMLGRHGGV